MDIYQEYIIELYKNPKNFGKLDDATNKAEIYNATCGDRITLYIKVDNGKITDSNFVGSGCAISQASSSLFAGYLKGKTVEEAKKITKEDVLKMIRIDLSKNPSRLKCALLPLEAMRKALD